MNTYSISVYASMLASAVTALIKDRDTTIEVVSVNEVNDQHLVGLIFHYYNATVTLYINDLYSHFLDGEDIREQARLVICQCRELIAQGLTEQLEVTEVHDLNFNFEEVRDQLCTRLLETRRNEGYLKDKPHKDIGCGFSLIAEVCIGESYSVPVTYGMLSCMHVDEDELFKEAIKSASEKTEPAILQDIKEVMNSFNAFPFFDEEPEKPKNLLEESAGDVVPGMYCLTNKSRCFGAATIAYPGVLDKAAKVLKGDFYILPASLHEVLLVPANAGRSKNDLQEIVLGANAEVVADSDILSDRVLYYEAASGTMSVA